MVRWAEITKEWKEEKPKHFWTHWFHDTYSESDAWWSNVPYPYAVHLCRTCKVWWKNG
jgi:hypothetical protein